MSGDAGAAPVQDAPPPFPLPPRLLVPLAMLVIGWLLVTPVVASVEWLPVVLSRAGLPYAIVATVVAVSLRLRAARQVRAAAASIDAATASGRSLAQRTSRVVAVALLALWVIVAVPFALQVEPGLAVVVGGPVIVGAVVSIAANARLLFSPRLARSEVAEVVARGAGRRRILTGWILAPLSWFAYAIPVQFIDALSGG